MTLTRTWSVLQGGRYLPAGFPQTGYLHTVPRCDLSIVIALLTLNPVATGMIAIGIFFYVVIYTAWLKRSNASNIVIGGLPEVLLLWLAGLLPRNL